MNNNNAAVLQELKELSAVKDRMLNAYDEKNEIEQRNRSELDSEINKYLEKKDELLGAKADELSELMPSGGALLNTKIPECKSKNISSLSAIIGIVFYVLLLMFLISFTGIIGFSYSLSFIIVIGLFVTGFMWMSKSSSISNYFNWEKSVDEWYAKTNAVKVSKQEFAEKCIAFEKRYEKVSAEYKNFEKLENEKLESKLKEIETPNRKRLDELEKIISEDYQTIQESTVLHKEYIGYIDDIIVFLESGRADDLKEALNLAIEEERKRENENARRQEAYRQEEILKEQARQNMLHNQEMERVERQRADDARAHAAQMEAQAKMQLQETKKLREEIAKQNNR